MKRLTLWVAVGAFIGAQAVNAQEWVTTRLEGWSRIYGLHFQSPDTGWAVGEPGNYTVRTTDGGQTWTRNEQIRGQTVTRLYAVHAKGSVVNIGGNDGNIFRSTNSGQTWNLVPVWNHYAYYNGMAEHNGVLLAVGTLYSVNGKIGALIARSTNGGASYTHQTLAQPPPRALMKVTADENGHFWAVGESELVLRSTDAGLTWENKSLNLGTDAFLRCVKAQGGKIYVAGYNATIFVTHNQGQTWQVLHNFGGPMLIHGIAINSMGMYIATVTSNLPNLYLSPDFGATWQVRDTSTMYRYTLFQVDSRHIWSSGNYGGDTITYVSRYVPPVNPVRRDTVGSVIHANVNLAFERYFKWVTPGDTLSYTVETNASFLRIDSFPPTSPGASNPMDSLTVRVSGSPLQVDTGQYWFKILVRNSTGVDSTLVQLEVHPVASVTQLPGLPQEFALEQNYPNPFNPVTRINISVPTRTHVTLKVYDYLGQEVATLVSQELQPGNYQTDFSPTPGASGVYFYRLQAGAFSQTRKLLFLK